MIFVRNPDYDPATDTPEMRQNLPDQFDFEINTNGDDIYNKVKAGEIDDEIAGETPKIVREYTTNRGAQDEPQGEPGQQHLLHPDDADRSRRSTTSTCARPSSYVMDKAGILRSWGGPTSGEIATHYRHAGLPARRRKDYDPYPSPGHAGDVQAAKAEMKQSTKYDTNEDGLCDAPGCKDVLLVTGTDCAQQGGAAGHPGVAREDRHHAQGPPGPRLLHGGPEPEEERRDLSRQDGWGPDYTIASTWFFYTTLSQAITVPFTYNDSLVGLTPKQATKLGLNYPAGVTVPSVDADYAACLPLAGDERTTCWQDYRQEADGGGRAVGPVHLAKPAQHHRRGSDAVGLRPVRLAARRGRTSRSTRRSRDSRRARRNRSGRAAGRGSPPRLSCTEEGERPGELRWARTSCGESSGRCSSSSS